MKLFKQIVVFTLLFIMIFSLVACDGEFQYGQNVGGGKDSSTDTDTDIDSGYEQPELNDDPTDDFTVTLLADGQPYTPRMEMYVYWNDGFSIHTAPVDKTGVARIDGLDGDYRVSLSAVPNEYTYDPNSNIATNMGLGEIHEVESSKKLFNKANKIAKAYGKKVSNGKLFTNDVFYNQSSELSYVNQGVVAVEMESFAILLTAKQLRKNAIAIATISDSLVTNETSSAFDRQQNFMDMVKIALEVAE